ncbi:hypothetical protein M2451_001123 [Dysgonomonas sp. PFB1-18]|uniref:hypothetical protein n=1 Tax=unclassified Dysgonomonas TaxID=2630389 RepID=UPI00247659D6|nr:MULTISPECIES: hypothetical protein [unclassified Dysgonomonas]MDL2303152.1 hypothetical protein [Dysgonomonas sp. OttesenSCG-928-D17]MDH6308252.1 hypothetical protein [Dysgonomonas sp. PF1-14]MDH6338309.1 hypothetical protein [Dysgonomonas sp. PF1-16]MDH6379806.1 hypothetical protein [Dysgonomonas sp. PFB1-18]MDH6397104.1 hypothetical protein [Dysgonomonas sp. PF1-23]
MRNLIFILLFLQTLFLFSQRETIKIVDTTFTASYPVLKIEEKSFINEIAAIVLEYKVHKKYKDRVFIIQQQPDTINNSILIIVSLEPLNTTSILDQSSPSGVINIQEIPFFYYGDKADIIYKTNDTMSFTRTRRLGYIYNNVFRKSGIGTYERLIWHFSYKDEKLKLLGINFI